MDALGALIIGVPVLYGLGVALHALVKYTADKAQTTMVGGAILLAFLVGLALLMVTS